MSDVTRTVSLRWESTDRWSALVPLSLLGGLGAACLAVMGLPPIDLHGPLHFVGVMDPLCGMTRAVLHGARGEVGTAVEYNPAVPLLPIGAGGALARWIHGRRTGRWAHLSIRWSTSSVIMVVLVVGSLWTRQQLNAAMLGGG
jgi:hypothetical protein